MFCFLIRIFKKPGHQFRGLPPEFLKREIKQQNRFLHFARFEHEGRKTAFFIQINAVFAENLRGFFKRFEARGNRLWTEAAFQKPVQSICRIEQKTFIPKRMSGFGEDVADYGNAFKLTKGMLEYFGRARVFNTPISEAAIVGTGVGMAMTGYRPVVELMYMDFALMASDQISNQAAKWHYMTGASTKVPMVIRCSVGGGKGYGGQHSQSLESIFAHIPGTYVVYPSNPYDAKGLIKT